MVEITFNERSLAQMTPEQHKALMSMCERFSKTLLRLKVMTGGFDLPQGYLTFVQEFAEKHTIYGGISPEGRVST